MGLDRERLLLSFILGFALGPSSFRFNLVEKAGHLLDELGVCEVESYMVCLERGRWLYGVRLDSARHDAYIGTPRLG